MVVLYGPIERVVEDREGFWNELDRVVDKSSNENRLCILWDLNW